MATSTRDKTRLLRYRRRALEGVSRLAGNQGRPRNVNGAVASACALLRIAALVALAGYLLFAHGCHADDDHELLILLRRVVDL
jgi:hypothetical protein